MLFIQFENDDILGSSFKPLLWEFFSQLIDKRYAKNKTLDKKPDH